MMKYIYLLIIVALIVLIITQGGSNKVEIKKTTQTPHVVYTHIYHEVNITETPNSISNIKPTVDAGDDQVVVVGQEVTLKAVASDKDGEIVSYEWREDGKLLSDKDSYSFTPTRGHHKIILSVKDNQGATVSDDVTVSAGKYYKSKIIEYQDNGEIRVAYITRNSEGNITKTEVDNGDDGSIDRVSLFSYDEDGKMLSFEYHNNGETYFKESYTYDESGKVVEEEESSIWQDGIEDYKYEYDDNGRKVRAIVEEDGVPSHEELYKYDSSSKVTEVDSVDIDGNLIDKTTYQYNESGKKISEAIDEDGDGKVDTKSTYNDNEKLTRYESSDYNKSIVYTSSGKIKERKYEGILDMKISYTYDKKSDKLLSVVRYDEKGVETSREISQYDENGNLVGTVDENGKTLSTVEFEFII